MYGGMSKMALESTKSDHPFSVPAPTKSTEPVRLLDFQRRFATDEACEQHLFAVRWPEGFVCPRCGCPKCYRIKKRGLYQCAECRYQASATAGTVMHRSHLPLRKWFWAIYLCATDKRGHSATALTGELEISYHTAWHVLHKLRNAMAERELRYILSGVVEVDDAYFGGEQDKDTENVRHSGRGTTKTKVAIGLATANDKPLYVKMQVLPVLTAEELSGFVLDRVDPDACVVTDSFKGYLGLSDIVSKHEMKVYAKEPAEFLKWIHTIISNAKAFIMGTYHGLDAKHLQAYLDEFCYRFNRRAKREEIFSRLLAACVDGCPLTYAELVA